MWQQMRDWYTDAAVKHAVVREMGAAEYDSLNAVVEPPAR